jgi:hypothetical protein
VFQDAATNPKVAVVVIGEKGYTHGTEWADKNPNISGRSNVHYPRF